MAVKEKLAVPIDPLRFAWPIKSKLLSTCSSNFDSNSQQVLVEILQITFDELIGTSKRTDDVLANTVTTIMCSKSFC